MPTPRLEPGHPKWHHVERAWEMRQNGLYARQIAEAMGVPQSTVENWLQAHARAIDDPAIAEAKSAVGTNMTPALVWAKVRNEDGSGYSVLLKPRDGGDADLAEVVRDAIVSALADAPPRFEPRPHECGEHLLVIDLADVHFLKLSVSSETGYRYDREVARHRVMQGTRALVRAARGFGIARILFVLGNDILHTDNARSTTTSGTPQDTDGSIFQGFKDALSCLRDAINECAEVAPVDLVHCMSNHDWVTGWALSQALGGIFEAHPHVRSTPYMLSEMHRKYYRFGSCLLGVSHGDGAKEEKLYALAVTEARQHISECQHIYWLLHHVHHKDRKRRGVDVFQTEKDHIGMTVISGGSFAPEGAHMSIEYVRSMTPPDGWHDRNGHVNRQGVECFLFHPHDGQRVRFTEWF